MERDDDGDFYSVIWEVGTLIISSRYLQILSSVRVVEVAGSTCSSKISSSSGSIHLDSSTPVTTSPGGDEHFIDP
jgi:hypothetical protein